MNELFALFANNLLPILLIAGAGYLLGTAFRVDARALALVTFNIFSPCLVYKVIAHSALASGEMLQMVAVALVATLGIGAAAWLAARALGLGRSLTSALVLTAMLPNAGNYGLSLNMLAFGSDALAHAGIYFATTSALMYTVGVFVASAGRADVRTALGGLARVPAVYAVALALLAMRFDWQLPVPLDRSLNLVADAAIPAFLVVLGLQLRRVQSFRPSRLLLLSGSLRLLAAPAMALVAMGVLGIGGAGRQAGLIESAMPTAVATTILAEAYDMEPTFATAAVFLTTLVSPLTLTPLLAWLGG